MTLYTVSFGTKEYQVEISNKNSKINGKSIQAALVELGEQGLYLLKKGAQKRELLVQALGNSQYSLNVNGKHAVVKVEKSNRRSQHKAGNPAEGDLKAPISGIVVKVNVNVGDQVAKDDVVIVLESMKMQMLMRASVDGTVTSVHVAPGAQLTKGDPMVKIE
jgi:biotin carboxyl carrier protein